MPMKKTFQHFWGLFGIQAALHNAEIYSGYYLSNETLFKIQSDVIRSLVKRNHAFSSVVVPIISLKITHAD